MRRTSRILLALAAFLAAVQLAFWGLAAADIGTIREKMVKFLLSPPQGAQRVLALAIVILLFVFSVIVFIYAVFGARMRKSRSKTTEVGTIDIGVGALENIALNAAKAAQAGIKTAKARVYAAPDEQITVELSVVLYSDVEIPLQMSKIQDRVKKDVEKYTGIGVREVKVKVTRVDLIGTRVER